MFARHISSSLYASRTAPSITSPKIKIRPQCMIEGVTHPCRAITKPCNITPGLLKESKQFVTEMEVRLKPRGDYQPFTVSYLTNNNPTDTGLMYWVCKNTLGRFANTNRWGTAEFHYNRDTPMLNYMNNLERVGMLENKSYDEYTNFSDITLGSQSVRSLLGAQLNDRKSVLNMWQLIDNGAHVPIQPPHELVIEDSFYIYMFDWRKVTLRCTTNNDPVATGLINWLFENMSYRAKIPNQGAKEILPSISVLTKPSYIPNTPILDALNRMERRYRIYIEDHNDRLNPKYWTLFTGVEIGAYTPPSFDDYY